MRATVIKALTALLAAIAAMLLAGCMRTTADELYSLPQASEEYLRLQRQINTILNQGAEFSPPVSGPNRQAVQSRDLDGDGVDEVIAFFTIPSDSTLKIYIFEMVGSDYAVAEIIEGVGTAIDSIRYADMDGDGVMELIVGWQMGQALKHMSIYSIRGFHSVLLAGAEYDAITVYDLSGDGNDDVILMRLPSQDLGAAAEVFTLMPDGEVITATAWLSNGITTITRVLTGKLTDGVPAIFVESEGVFDEGFIVTDVLVYLDGVLTNVSLTVSTGVSEQTVRDRFQSSDVNRDGIIKVPTPRPLKVQTETPYYAIDWYSFDSTGAVTLALTTYHNNVDEWFLILPFDWREKVSVRREDVVAGERTVIFSYIVGEDGPYEDFLKVYRLTGDNGLERARLPGRVKLQAEGTAVYAFELLEPPNSFGLTFDEALIRDNFRLIYSDWIAGTA